MLTLETFQSFLNEKKDISIAFNNFPANFCENEEDFIVRDANYPSTHTFLPSA